MTRICFIALIVLAVICTMTACSKKEEAKEGAAVTQEAAKPAVEVGKMILIPAGEFTMGTDDKKNLAYPAHKVNLPAFWIDEYEVTNKQYLSFASKTGYITEGAKEGKDWMLFWTPEMSNFPVVYITWKDADAYCKADGRRLPTEEEWEKAARGPNGNRFPWGNEWIDGRSNTYEAGNTKPVAVGTYDDVSFYGVHDMLGNVQEWTSSWYKPYKGNLVKDSQANDKMRVVRGLSAVYKSKGGSLWERSAWVPEALYNFGFRCVKDATPEDAAKAAQPK